MTENTVWTTDRLSIQPLTTDDNKFILELVNTEGWLRFIGERNVHSESDAIAYIQRILDNKNVTYWVVKLKNSLTPVGVITFIQRDYLEHPDIGFAFLPNHNNNGYAYEAAKSVFEYFTVKSKLSYVLATTIPENISSIKLLKKLGLSFEKEIEIDALMLHVYGISVVN